MRQALLDANSVAHVNCTTILYGESGVGKEVVAKYIHSHSRRSQGPFIAVNCAALPEQLIESELFGYEKGAFSGASPDGKIGLFEAAHKGTLLLDEIAEFPLSLQAKLLRTLETGEVRRVGSNKNYKIDFRLIAATHRDLREMCEKGLFRTDLFYRLNVVSIKIPPLRERREDISALVRHFLAEFEKKYEMHTVVGSEILEYFAKCDWPDNARELRNAVEKLVVMSGQKNFSEYLTMPEAMLSSDHYRLFRNIPPQSLKEARQNFEEQYIINALNICGGRLGETSKYLGVSRRFLYRKIKAMEEKKNIANYPNLSAHQKSTFPSKITELILAESERDKGNKI
jgi:transcriptional regulator with PAS, ATPase and Fis domain